MTAWSGDQFNQYGDHNVGKIDLRTGDVVNRATPVETAEAVGELAAFVAHLHRAGLLSPTGDPVDPEAIAAEVSKEESKLRKVAKALGRGAAGALSKAMSQVVVPLVLKLVQERLR